MARVSSKGRITFGFRNINGRAFDIKIVNAPKGTFIDRDTIPRLQSYVRRSMNKHGLRAEKTAKKSSHSPIKTRRLIESIFWKHARSRGLTGVIIGTLNVNVPYGRRQEFEHPTKSRYLQRAINQHYPSFLSDLKKRGFIESIVLGKRRQTATAGARGGTF